MPTDPPRRTTTLGRAVTYLDVPRSFTPPIWLELLPSSPPRIRWGRIAPATVAHSVVLVPGFLAPDQTTSALAASLRVSGHRTHHAHLEAVSGCSEVLATRLVSRLEDLAATHQQPVTLIGHSRGGQLAKVAARRRPDLVRGLITLVRSL